MWARLTFVVFSQKVNRQSEPDQSERAETNTLGPGEYASPSISRHIILQRRIGKANTSSGVRS